MRLFYSFLHKPDIFCRVMLKLDDVSLFNFWSHKYYYGGHRVISHYAFQDTFNLHSMLYNCVLILFKSTYFGLKYPFVFGDDHPLIKRMKDLFSCCSKDELFKVQNWLAKWYFSLWRNLLLIHVHLCGHEELC